MIEPQKILKIDYLEEKIANTPSDSWISSRGVTNKLREMDTMYLINTFKIVRRSIEDAAYDYYLNKFIKCRITREVFTIPDIYEVAITTCKKRSTLTFLDNLVVELHRRNVRTEKLF